MLQEVTIEGYRSIRHVRLPLKQVTVVTGANGTGKSNLYKALHLLAQGACGSLAEAIAREGGLSSVSWAGPAKKEDNRIKLSAAFDEWAYSFSCGVVASADAPDTELDPVLSGIFKLDPAVKEESLEYVKGRKHIAYLKRNQDGALLRNREGAWAPHLLPLRYWQSALASVRDPHEYPELEAVRHRFERWRFYHHFSTELASPLRRPQFVTQAPILSHSGDNLAAALATIVVAGQDSLLNAAVEAAFPGTSLSFHGSAQGLTIGLQRTGLFRALAAPELSDGTLRYLCLLAALLSAQPAEFIAINEPESSLHPDLIRPLAGLIAQASSRTQIWVTTHSQELARHLQDQADAQTYEIDLVKEETKVKGQGLLDW